VIRDVAARRATLLRRPELAPSTGPSQLPDFDITIDHFAIERMNVAKPVAGSERRVDLAGGFHLAKGVIHLSLDGRLGGEDRLAALVDAQPKKDIFALKFTYDAPKGGLAALAGSAAERHIRIDGKGTWASWKGRVDATQDGRPAVKLGLGQAGAPYRHGRCLCRSAVFARYAPHAGRIAHRGGCQRADGRQPPDRQLALAAQALR
jgi:translocation and assembly module TamB